jgi:uncharacterized protein (UPF0333 family)
VRPWILSVNDKEAEAMISSARKAQGLLEYTLLLGAIIAIVIVVLMGKNGIGNTTKVTYNNAGNAITATMTRAQGDTGVFNAGAGGSAGGKYDWTTDPVANGAQG